MKRSAKIYILLLVWISAMLQFFINDTLDINETLAQVNDTHEEVTAAAQITAWGVYGDAGYSERTVQKIIANTAAQFGQTKGYLSVEDIPCGRCFRFSGISDEYTCQVEFILDEKNNCSCLVVSTDNTKDIRDLRTFYTKLNIDYRMSINVDLTGLTETSESSMLDAFDIYAVKKTGNFLYGKVSTAVPFPEFSYGKNVCISTGANQINIKFGDDSELEEMRSKTSSRNEYTHNKK